MRITDITITPVAMRDSPLRNSTGVHSPHFLRSIIEMHTDEGLVGLGESYGRRSAVAELEGAKTLVLGEDPYHLERLKLKVRSLVAYAAFEVACLDIIGKAVDRPVCDLLGGKVRDRVPYSAYLFFKYADEEKPPEVAPGEVSRPEEMVEEAREFIERYGFKTLKLKGGVLPPDEEAETLRLMRKEFGDGCQLRIDPNAIWSVETSLRFIRKTRDLDLEYVEDPTSGLEGMALVNRSVDVPLSTNMCVTTFAHISPAVRMGAVDVILSDHHRGWAGLTGCKRLGAICETFNIGLSQHSNNHLGISMAAMTHMAASIPNLIYASDTHYPWTREDVILGGKLQFKEGCMEVPKGPGLGVELDEGQVAKFAENYGRMSQPRRDNSSEMRKRYPHWLPFRPRW